MKLVVAPALACFLAGLCAADARVQEPQALAVPLGKPAEIDGRMPDAEWADAVEIKVAKEGMLRIKHDGSTLFLAHSKLPPGGFACLFVKSGTDARILHASAQLGTALYLKKNDAWNPKSKDYAWKKADRMWTEEGWKASDGFAAGQEFAVSFKTLGIEGDAKAILAFGYVHFEGREGKSITWPETGDACADAKLLAGWNPEGLKFDFTKWAVIRPSAGGPANPAAAIAELVRRLASDRLVDRDEAMQALSLLKPSALPDLEKDLAHEDPEVRLRLETAVGRILGASLGTRVMRMELRPIGDREVHAKWKLAGADPAKPPKGYAAIRNHADPNEESEELKGDWILVEPAVATNEDVRSAEVAPHPLVPEMWDLQFRLIESAAKRFDDMAALLCEREPKGQVAIVLDGRVQAKPRIMSPDFQGAGVIAGLKSREEADTYRSWMKAAWFEVSLVVEGGKDGEEARKAMIKELGLAPEAVELGSDGALRLKSAHKLPDRALYGAWRSLRKLGFTLRTEK